jgi:hypothetical protein
MVASNPFAHPMAHLFIAQQARIPTLVIGDPGDGKTALHRALCRAMNRRFILLLGSQCSPEDVAGLPVPDHVKFLCRMMPMWWVEAMLTPGGTLCLDEFMSVPPSVQAALLTVIQDKLVGEVYLDTDTIICAMANPLEQTPNGTPLSLPTLNRFFHAKWECDDEAWLDGLATCEWDAPPFPVVPAGWESLIPKWGARVASFHRRQEGVRSVVPKDDTTFSFPTRRTWENSIKCLAAADAAGADMTSNQQWVRAMVAGNVGEVVANQFSTFNAALDLVDPIEVLDGKAKFVHKDSRPDLTFALCASVVSALLAAGTFSEDRWNRGAALLGSVGTEVAPEIALKFTRLLHKAAADRKYAPPAKALKPLLELAAAMKS